MKITSNRDTRQQYRQGIVAAKFEEKENRS
jgi:hypothetical protein